MRRLVLSPALLPALYAGAPTVARTAPVVSRRIQRHSRITEAQRSFSVSVSSLEFSDSIGESRYAPEPHAVPTPAVHAVDDELDGDNVWTPEEASLLRDDQFAALLLSGRLDSLAAVELFEKVRDLVTSTVQDASGCGHASIDGAANDDGWIKSTTNDCYAMVPPSHGLSAAGAGKSQRVLGVGVKSYSAVLSCSAHAIREAMIATRSADRMRGGGGGEVSHALEVVDELIVQFERLFREFREQFPLTAEVCCTAIWAFGNGHRCDSALNIFEIMRLEGILPDSFIFYAALSAVSRAGRDKQALSMLLEDMPRCEVQRLPRHYMAAMTACMRSRNFVAVVDLFGRMRASESFEIPASAFNLVLSALSTVDRDRALDLLDEMFEHGPQPDSYSLLAVLRSCRSVREALLLLDQAISRGLEVDLRHFTVVLRLCSLFRSAPKAFQVMAMMESRGIMPDLKCYGMALRACGSKKSHIETFQQILSKNSVMLDVELSVELMEAFVISGQWRRAISCLNDLQKLTRSAAVPPRAIQMALRAAASLTNDSKRNAELLSFINRAESAGTVLSAESLRDAVILASRIPDADAVVRYFARLCELDVCDVGIAEIALLTYSQLGMWLAANRTIDALRRRGVAPSLLAYTRAIVTCSRNDQPDLVLDLMDRMPADRVTPSTRCFREAIACLGRKSDINGVRTLLAQMEALDVRMTSACLRDAMFAFGSNGRGMDALEIFQKTVNRGLHVKLDTLVNLIEAMYSGNDGSRSAINAVVQRFCNKVARLREDGIVEIDMAGISGVAARYLIEHALVAHSHEFPSNPPDIHIKVGSCRGRNAPDHSMWPNSGTRAGVLDLLQRDFHPPIAVRVIPGSADILEVNSETIARWQAESERGKAGARDE